MRANPKESDKKPHTHCVRGASSVTHWVITQPSSLLTYKEESYMCSGCGSPHRGQGPSSVTQLPILTALHARNPTLFALIIHEKKGKVNPQLQNIPLSGFLPRDNGIRLETNGNVLFIMMKKL